MPFRKTGWLIVAALLMLASLAPAQDTQPATLLLPWHTSYAEALDDARQKHQPIIAEVGAEWCEWCRLLDQEIAKPPAQEKLTAWVRLKVDSDRDTEVVRKLAVGPIPALRILAPGGRVIAARNGFLNVQDLVAWLNDHYAQAVAVPSEQLAATTPATAEEIDGLIKELTNPDPITHEAASRRLTRSAPLAAPKVITALQAGTLRQRLPILELLSAWGAPVDGLDPWEASSLTPERIGALKKWAESVPAIATTRPASLTPDQLLTARRDIAAMLQAGNEAEVQSPRERLARLGSALLPEVQLQMSTAGTDQDRERLLALRYRLSASETLALKWPDGFERIASTNQQARRASLDDLSSKLSPDDEPFLLELFSSPDPFVRERSIEFMQAVGSDGARAGLIKLLHDPESNVRAAVLRQLSETPDAQLVPEISKYAGVETDQDLVVHAVRFLRQVKTPSAIQSLVELLKNPNWRVRAESAAALGECLQSNSGSDSTGAICDAMVALLDDPDSFVASQALLVFKHAPISSYVPPLVKAAEKRPELTNDVVQLLGSDRQRNAATKQLHKYAAGTSNSVRSAALKALGSNVEPGELADALKSDDGALRLTAADVLMTSIEAERPDSRENENFQRQNQTLDWTAWLDKFHSDAGRPKWAGTVVPSLKQMLASTQPAEKTAAAIALAALSEDPQPVKILDESSPDAVTARKIAEVLPWVKLDDRLRLFKKLWGAFKTDKGVTRQLIELLAKTPDEGAAPALWEALAEPSSDLTTARDVYDALAQIYFVNGFIYSSDPSQGNDRAKRILPAAKQFAASGSAAQRIVALDVLLRAAPEDAAKSAADIMKQEKLGAGLNTTAYQVLLLSLPKEDATKRAVEQLSVDNHTLRNLSLAYLAIGPTGVQLVQGELYLQTQNAFESMSFGSGQAISVAAPAGLKAEILQAALKDPDAETQAYAGYLLCLLNNRVGLAPLLGKWRQQPAEDTWRRLVYRAVAAFSDDAQTTVLEEVYRTFTPTDWNIREFYWTIRSMDGPNILKLRKKIRDDVGMERLR